MIFKQLFDTKSSTYTYLISSGNWWEALIFDPVLRPNWMKWLCMIMYSIAGQMLLIRCVSIESTAYIKNLNNYLGKIEKIDMKTT